MNNFVARLRGQPRTQQEIIEQLTPVLTHHNLVGFFVALEQRVTMFDEVICIPQSPRFNLNGNRYSARLFFVPHPLRRLPPETRDRVRADRAAHGPWRVHFVTEYRSNPEDALEYSDLLISVDVSVLELTVVQRHVKAALAVFSDFGAEDRSLEVLFTPGDVALEKRMDIGIADEDYVPKRRLAAFESIDVGTLSPIEEVPVVEAPLNPLLRAAKICASCYQPSHPDAALFDCANCKRAAYCSERCQRLHDHQYDCKSTGLQVPSLLCVTMCYGRKTTDFRQALVPLRVGDDRELDMSVPLNSDEFADMPLGPCIGNKMLKVAYSLDRTVGIPGCSYNRCPRDGDNALQRLISQQDFKVPMPFMVYMMEIRDGAPPRHLSSSPDEIAAVLSS